MTMLKEKKFRERNIPTGSQFPSASNSRGPQNVALQLFTSNARYPVDNLRPGFVFVFFVEISGKAPTSFRKRAPDSKLPRWMNNDIHALLIGLHC